VRAITPTSEAFLKDIDVWDLIERKYAFTDTKVWDKNSHGALDYCTHTRMKIFFYFRIWIIRLNNCNTQIALMALCHGQGKCLPNHTTAHNDIIENDCIQSAMYMALADTKVEFISAKLDDINKTKQGYCLNLNDEQQLPAKLYSQNLCLSEYYKQ
jgi:2-octaprenyl-3-methyl-6-methoxy-1,4-benzoquinol hydroxylase/2-octaprenylphenol hydroxylase